ncbi:MAG: putative primase/helicase [Aliidongia sp.]|jgi:P4 family phage/plasmid primase-like protien|nr:putative primase/helicase [Aliidongia sp.]
MHGPINSTNSGSRSTAGLVGDTEAAVNFLQKFRLAGTVCLVAIVPDGPTEGRTFDISDQAALRAWIEERQGRKNLYFTVNEARRGLHKKPAKDDMITAHAIWIDVDPREEEEKTAGGFERERVRLAALADELQHGAVPPSFIIDSGNGHQFFWLLDQPCALDPAATAIVEALGKGLRMRYGGDAVENVDRIMRLPGTLNLPTKSKRERGRGPAVAKLVASAGRRYSLPELQQLTGPLDDLRASDPAKRIGDPELLAEDQEMLGRAIDRWPNEYPYPDAIRMLAAMKAGCGGDWAFLVEHVIPWGARWQQQVGDYDAEQAEWTERKLDTLHDSHVGADLVYAEAYERTRHLPRSQQFNEVAGFDDLGDGPDAEGKGEAPKFSEGALAVEFVRRHPGWRYVALWGRWFEWQGYRWAFEETAKAKDLAHAVGCDTARIGLQNKGQTAKKLASDQTANAVERLARVNRAYAATAKQWDQDPWLLATPDGTVDLRTGQMRPAQRDDYITKSTAVAPGGGCPIWLKFLASVTGGDAELVAYLQRVAGYSLTGITSEQALFFLYGSGGNGKGTYINTLVSLMGDYAAVASMDSFVASHNDRHSTEIAMLRGARLVSAQETEEGRHWAEAKIKALTGGDPITARFMKQDNFTFQPQFKLMIAGNHRPKLSGADPAMRRRFNLLPFNQTFIGKQTDQALPEKLKVEWPGILAWAIEGCLLWQIFGLMPPPVVTQATDDYFVAQDAFQKWLDECVASAPDANETWAALWASWRNWCGANHESAGTTGNFSQKLEKGGFVRATIDNVRCYSGLCVQETGGFSILP